MKDYYKALGVAETASQPDIKKAYRKLAKRFHPDATGGDKSKEARFKDVTEAYEVLGDEKKRSEYDEQRKNPYASMGGGGFPPGASRSGPGGANVDLNDILNRLRNQARTDRQQQRQPRAQPQQDPFSGGAGGFADLFEMFGGAPPEAEQPRQRARGEDVLAKLEIELPEAALGAEKEIVLDGKHITIKIPAGVTDGKTIRLAGRGQPGGRGQPLGDLMIEVHEKPHDKFRRRSPASADIEVDLPVTLEAAVLGGKAEVPTLEGNTVTLTIPAGSSSGRKLRLRRKGAVAKIGDKENRGDLYANVQIQLPEAISDEAKELIRQFSKITTPTT